VEKLTKTLEEIVKNGDFEVKFKLLNKIKNFSVLIGYMGRPFVAKIIESLSTISSNKKWRMRE
jgi:hypothetical protein